MFQTEFGPAGRRKHHRAGAAAGQDLVVEGVVPLVWEEHCTECAFPTCYSTCALYRRRDDGHCARFVNGIEVVDAGAERAHRIGFGRWAKLEARLPAVPLIAGTGALGRLEAVQEVTGGAVRRLPASVLREKALVRFGFARTAAAHRLGKRATRLPDGLLLDVELVAEFVPSTVKEVQHEPEAPSEDAGDRSPTNVRARVPAESAMLRLVLETAGPNGSARTSTTLSPGRSKSFVAASDLGIAEGRWPDRIFLIPENDAEIDLVVHRLELVYLDDASRALTGTAAGPAPATVAPPKVRQPANVMKCVVFDLDNTLWNGTLVDVGPGELQLRSGVESTLKTLDERGILLSIASKNDAAPAMAELERLGIADYFLHPQISWGPKSQAMLRIAHALNLGIDSFAFVDDQPFERGEVAEQIGAIRMYDEDAVELLCSRPEFDVAVTAESRGRRAMYRTESARKLLEADAGDYDAFLRNCEIVLDVERPSGDAIERCVELFLRTNQLNLTTRRLGRDEFVACVESPTQIVVSLRAADRFGGYGIIGVAIVDTSDATSPVLTDFVTSCRVAQKAVEAGFFEWLRVELLGRNDASSGLRATFVPTDRNHLLRDVLKDVGFRSESDDAPDRLVLDLRRSVPRGNIITVTAS